MLNKQLYNLHLLVLMAELVKLISLDRMTDGEMISVWKEVVTAYLHLPGVSDEHKNLSGQMMFWAGYELSTSQTQA